MSANAAIADALDQIAKLMELLGENRFKVIAHQRAARAIRDFNKDAASLDQTELEAIDGIGEKIAKKIVEYAETGAMTELKELREKVPAGLIDILNIPGLGPKTVATMWKEAGITDMASLKKALDDGSLEDLPRMGKKTIDNIKDAIAFSESSGERLPLGVALPVTEHIVERLAKLEHVKKVAYAGSLRRGKETIGDIDILCVSTDPDATRDAFTTMEEVTKVLAAGETKSSIRFNIKALGITDAAGSAREIQVDLRLVPEESWGAAIMYFTGSKEHNVRLRERAQKKNLTLNEYGLYKDDGEAVPQSRGAKPLAAKTEDGIYKKLDVTPVPPELREDRGEFDLDAPPSLIDLADIKAELHAHTTASDGRLQLEELIDAAQSRGFHTLAVTDHSKSSVQANGLSPDRLREQIEQVHEANEKHKGKKNPITVLAGSEVDILATGTLDYDDDLLAELDLVVASPHAALTQDTKKATARLLKVIEHPLVHILGHPTGRLIPRRKGLEPDMHELLAAAKEHNVALEINAHWKRLDLRDTHVRMAVEAGCLIAIDCDVHRREHFDNLRFGVMTGRRGWLPAEQCVNTWSQHRLLSWLAKGR